MTAGIWRYRVLRTLGRAVTRTCAALTLWRMPPFVSASVIVVDGSRLLAVIDPLRREPILPGGHLSWNERPEEAAVREVREETGIEVELDELIAVLSGKEWAGEAGIVRVIYRGRVIGGQLVSSPEGEARWLELDEVLQGTSRDAPIVRKLIQESARFRPSLREDP